MIIFPAIDILGAKCVRLKQGDYSNKTIYYENPLDAAKAFINDGAKVIHVVDLDAAKEGSPRNFEVINNINELDIDVEIGGGIRSREDIEKYINKDIFRISIGTKGVEDFDFLKEVAFLYPNKISLSLDVKDEYVYVKGWVENSGVLIWDYLEKVGDLPLASIVVTDISKDGMLQGLNIPFYKKLIEKSAIPIVASGGVSCKDDIDKLREINMYGVIVGKAIYEGKVSLKEIL